MFVETLHNFIFFARMRHEMLDDHTSIDECTHIELLFEFLLHEAVLFRRFESLVKATTRIFEGQRLELVLQLDPQPLLLSFSVQNFVAEED